MARLGSRSDARLRRRLADTRHVLRSRWRSCAGAGARHPGVHRLRRPSRLLPCMEKSLNSRGTWWLVGLAGLAIASAIVLRRTGGKRDWRWLRWPLALVILIAALGAATTAPWPRGIGLQSCQTVVNPALTHAEHAKPMTLRTCSDIG